MTKTRKNAPLKVLLIDDEADTLLPWLAQNLEPLGFSFLKETDADKGLGAIEQHQPNAVLLDLHFPEDASRTDGRTTGGELLPKIRRQFRDLPILVFTTRLDDAAYPLETFDEVPHGRFSKSKLSEADGPQALSEALHDTIDTAKFASSPDKNKLLGFLVGQTEEMGIVAGQIRTAARNRLNVLICGDTGSGKQLAAEAIHRLSGRTGRFEQINCSGVDENTLEDKLFGHKRGAYTGAQTDAPGIFEIANDGTVFLDEIQHMPIALQHKLKLVIERGTIRRMGASDDKKVDIKVVAATNHYLDDLVAEGHLQEDLAYRLAVSVIFLPTLRQRMLDLPEFFALFVDYANQELHKHILPTLRPETRKKLEAHTWPGNIRELKNTILRAAAKTTANVLLPEDIDIAPIGRRSQDLTPNAASREPEPPNTPSPVEQLTDQLEALPQETGERYQFLLKQGIELRSAILTEFICRLRHRTGRTVRHKALAWELDPNTKHDAIRQTVCKCVKLLKLECNR